MENLVIEKGLEGETLDIAHKLFNDQAECD